MATVVEGTLPAKRSAARVRRFRQFAWAVLGYNVLVVLWGAYVRASGSGAGCGGNWPLCNGQVLPRAPQIQTIVEFSHRVMSGLALFAVVSLCLAAFRLFPRGHRLRRLSAASVVFLCVEALLGAGLVLFDYVAHNASIGRAIYLAAHLTNTLLLLASLAATAWYAASRPIELKLKEVPWLFWSALPLAILVSITGSIAALGDTLFPSTTLAAGMHQDFSPAASFLVRLRLVHPIVAAVSALLFVVVAAYALRTVSRPTMRVLAMVVILSTVAQLCAGLVNLALLAPVWMQILHLFLADVVWIALVLFVAEAAVPVRVTFQR
ncbi:MAG: COX15/CtaA family protein [Bryobacteraceae bacterium]